MILVDSSVWIDFFNGKENLKTNFLNECLGIEIICIGDLICAEVLQGFTSDHDYEVAKDLFENLPFFQLIGKEQAIQSANNFRLLRKKGITIRKTIHVIIATFCISNDISILHNDKDFEAFVTYLGLKSIF